MAAPPTNLVALAQAKADAYGRAVSFEASRERGCWDGQWQISWWSGPGGPCGVLCRVDDEDTVRRSIEVLRAAGFTIGDVTAGASAASR